MRLRYVLFDLDGTLVDSAPLHEAAFRATLARFASDRPASFNYEAVKGLSTRASFVQVGLEDPSQLSQCIAEKQRLYREALRLGALRAFPQARELLEMIKGSGGSSFVVSSGSRNSVSSAIAGAGIADLIAGVVDADDTPQGKPAPDPYLICLRRYGLDRRAAIAIEDAAAGVASARAAGLRVIGVHNPEICGLADEFYANFAALIEALHSDRLGAEVGP